MYVSTDLDKWITLNKQTEFLSSLICEFNGSDSVGVRKIHYRAQLLSFTLSGSFPGLAGSTWLLNSPLSDLLCKSADFCTFIHSAVLFHQFSFVSSCLTPMVVKITLRIRAGFLPLALYFQRHAGDNNVAKTYCVSLPISVPEAAMYWSRELAKSGFCSWTL